MFLFVNFDIAAAGRSWACDTAEIRDSSEWEYSSSSLRFFAVISYSTKPDIFFVWHKENGCLEGSALWKLAFPRKLCV